MREILFRAKHIHTLPRNEHLDGRWIEGYLSDKNHINSPELEGDFSVDPETIGQYTGLKDKDGKKIFEGDILSVTFKETRIGAEEKVYTYTVVFNQSEASWELSGNSDLLGRPCLNESNQHIFKIVGNIFDNPELVKSNA